jgi:uncharacterized protein (DUF305 family)
VKRLAVVAAALLALTTVAGACGTAQTDHKTADVSFGQGMVLQDRQAVAIADMAANQAESPKVKDLAVRIKAAREPEIVKVSAWLKTWGARIPASAADTGTVTNPLPGGLRVLSAAELDTLSKATGKPFDQNFLGRMIDIDEGAIGLAQKDLDNGRYGPAKDLARSTIKDRRSEVDELVALLRGLI